MRQIKVKYWVEYETFIDWDESVKLNEDNLQVNLPDNSEDVMGCEIVCITENGKPIDYDEE